MLVIICKCAGRQQEHVIDSAADQMRQCEDVKVGKERYLLKISLWSKMRRKGCTRMKYVASV